jgi:HK97 family phage prohead protease
MNQHERRAGRILELRAAPGNMPKIVGYPAVFDQLSENLGYFREKVARGAFKDSIRTDDVRALFNHDPKYVLGRNKAGTLTLREDAHGLAAEIDPPDSEFARDLIKSIQRGDISGMSFAFDVEDDNWAVENGETVRTLKRVKLLDVSPVTYPAYSQTDVSTRSLESIFEDGRRRLGRGAAIGRPSGIAMLRLRLQIEEA